MTNLDAIKAIERFLKEEADEINRFNHWIGFATSVDRLCRIEQSMRDYVRDLRGEINRAESYGDSVRNYFTGDIAGERGR